MPEYVYALHDFAPEHEDEISFSAGDRIEVIEKDDMYGDGWWQGRNLFGKVGLFPQSYTTSDASVIQSQAAPQPEAQDAASPTGVSAAPLQTLNEESESASITSEGKKSEVNENGMMRATMTDVQEAIEQLGRNDRDGGASFSFASTHDTDRETETDRETDSEAWHKGARSNLAEKARQQQQLLQEEQDAYDAALGAGAPVLNSQHSEPPIDFELSDESEDEDGVHEARHAPSDTHLARREHAHNLEEEENDESSKVQMNGNAGSPKPIGNLSEQQQSAISLIVQGLDETQDPPTARQTSFPIQSETDAEKPEDTLPATTKPHPESIASTVQVQNTSRLGSPPLLTPTSPSTFASQQRQKEEPVPSASLSRVTSELEMKRMGSPQGLPSPPRSQDGTISTQSKFLNTPASEWSVEDVVEWAKSKGFDNSVCDKFVEHEISGDVLLELDANVLKTELEIHAFGKRTRIMKEVAELRRPPSVQSSVPPSHSRTISQSFSLPGSAHHSMISPMTANRGPESPPHTGDLPASPGMGGMGRDSDPSSSHRDGESDLGESTAVNGSMVGFGFGATPSITTGSTIGSSERLDMPKGKGRPAYLNLSPSDHPLKPKTSAKFSPMSTLEDERAALSDTESAVALDSRSRRRRMFGRSTVSANSDPKEPNGRPSNETRRGATTPVSVSMSLPGSPSTKRGSEEGGAKPRQRRKRSTDASRPTDRLSLFGGSISIGRARKPAPRVPSSYAHDDTATTEKNGRGFSRLYLGSSAGRKTSGKAPAGGDDRGSEDNDSANVPSPTLLRKRTSSAADVPTLPGISGGLKSGVSVLEQIGAPDHNGWMLKKGEHYNTWKLRYFVLKGPHLYYLRSNSKTETKIKGYINIIGYKVVVDENINPGKYGFRIIHDTERTHYFCSDESIVIREWMKALMKATIGRDYSKPVISSCNIPTIPLAIAQTMNPAPRPPSPTQRDATQKALRRENPNQLSSRDARILMGLPQASNANGNANGAAVDGPPSGRTDNSFFTLDTLPEASENDPTPMVSRANSSDPTAASIPPPARPSRETRRMNVPQGDVPNAPTDLIRWANELLPEHLRITESGGQIYSGLALYRLAEAIKGKPTEPAVPDSAFPSGPNDDRLDGLFKLFDFFLDNDIRMGNVSINDVRQGHPDKIIHLLRSLKAWDDKRRQLARSIGRSGVHAGPFMAMESSTHAW